MMRGSPIPLYVSESHGQEFGHMGVVERIVHHAPVPAIAHDAQVPQQAQVLRDRRNSQSNCHRQLANALLTL